MIKIRKIVGIIENQNKNSPISLENDIKEVVKDVQIIERSINFENVKGDASSKWKIKKI